MERTITADQIDFGVEASTPVFSDTLRFVLPVPAFPDGGEPLVHPPGDRAGEAFKDRNGRPILGRGVVFFDPDDRSWEVAPGDGSGVVIFGPITESQGARLVAKVKAFAGDPNDLTLDQLKAVIRFAGGDLGIRTAYSSTKTYVATAMTAVNTDGRSAYGLHRRKAGDLCRAIYVEGRGRFLGPAASPQLFADGAVILRHGESIRLIQPRSFEETYRLLDGRPARVSELATQSPA
jgi:hypothetical protein